MRVEAAETQAKYCKATEELPVRKIELQYYSMITIFQFVHFFVC